MTFSEYETRLATGTLRFFAAGSGRPLLYLSTASHAPPNRLVQSLAESHHVYIPLLPPENEAEAISSAATSADLAGSFIERDIGARADIVAHPSGVPAALWLATQHPNWVDQTVLQSPTGLVRAADPDAGDATATEAPLIAKLRDIDTLALVVAGADDREAAENGRLLKARLPHSYLVYIQGAGRDIEADQPEFLTRVVRDFLTWGEGFLIRRKT